MITNASATLYSRIYNADKRMDEWKRTLIEKVWWYESEASSITSEGLKRADNFCDQNTRYYDQHKKDDYLVKGICNIDITTAKDLKGTECCKVTSANYNTYGANPHIKVGGV